MRVPFLENALIEEQKIVGYLLSESHEKGRGKAKFFKHFGFSVAQWDKLKQAFLRHLIENPVAEIVSSEEAVKYVVEGPLHTPIGRSPRVRAIWRIENGTTFPRLITAVPIKSEDDTTP